MENITAECPLHPRKCQIRLQKRIDQVFELLQTPSVIRLEFSLHLVDALNSTSKQQKKHMERLVQLWEQVYDSQQQWLFLRLWRAEIECREDLLEAASTQPNIVLPDSTYAFMVAKDIFKTHQDGDHPVQWLDILLDSLKSFYLGTLTTLREESGDWKLALDYISTLPTAVNDYRL